eukprot:354554-Chlamydomonas_euryale.AAC.3
MKHAFAHHVYTNARVAQTPGSWAGTGQDLHPLSVVNLGATVSVNRVVSVEGRLNLRADLPVPGAPLRQRCQRQLPPTEAAEVQAAAEASRGS